MPDPTVRRACARSGQTAQLSTVEGFGSAASAARHSRTDVQRVSGGSDGASSHIRCRYVGSPTRSVVALPGHVVHRVEVLVPERFQHPLQLALGPPGEHLAQDPRPERGDGLGRAGEHVRLGGLGVDLDHGRTQTLRGDEVVKGAHLDVDLAGGAPETAGERVGAVGLVGQVERGRARLTAQGGPPDADRETVGLGDPLGRVGRGGGGFERHHLAVGERRRHEGIDPDVGADIQHLARACDVGHRQEAGERLGLVLPQPVRARIRATYWSPGASSSRR